jgi:hypothetical protein
MSQVQKLERFVHVRLKPVAYIGDLSCVFYTYAVRPDLIRVLAGFEVFEAV